MRRLPDIIVDLENPSIRADLEIKFSGLIADCERAMTQTQQDIQRTREEVEKVTRTLYASDIVRALIDGDGAITAQNVWDHIAKRDNTHSIKEFETAYRQINDYCNTLGN